MLNKNAEARQKISKDKHFMDQQIFTCVKKGSQYEITFLYNKL